MNKYQLLFASKSPGKISEWRIGLKDLIPNLLTLNDFLPVESPEENGTSFLQNAKIKALFYSSKIDFKPVAAEDSGLVIPSLNGGPGIHSSRFASLKSDKERNDYLLLAMKGMKGNERKAHFECVIILIDTYGYPIVFRGRCFGLIAMSQNGYNGFGYDPLFYYPQKNKTFAELSTEEKLSCSHRGRALLNLGRYILSKHS